MDLTETEIGSEVLYEGKSFSFSLDEVRLPDGSVRRREVLHHPGGVAILALREGKVLLERQYRYPVRDELVEIPAGKLDKIPDERPEDAARRELLEETGYTAASLLYLGKVYAAPGVVSEVLHIYFAEGLEKKEKQDLDEDEFLEVRWEDLGDVWQAVREGRMTDSKLLCALCLAKARGLV